MVGCTRQANGRWLAPLPPNTYGISASATATAAAAAMVSITRIEADRTPLSDLCIGKALAKDDVTARHTLATSNAPHYGAQIPGFQAGTALITGEFWARPPQADATGQSISLTAAEPLQTHSPGASGSGHAATAAAPCLSGTALSSEQMMHIELNRAKAVERKRCREASVQTQPPPTDTALPCSGAMQGFHVGPALVTGQFWAAAHRDDSIAQDALSPAAGLRSVTQEREEDPLAEAISAAAEAAEQASNCAADARAGLLDPSTEIGAHALRSAARVKALAKPAKGRYDTEGLDRADVEAGSSLVFRRFVASLSFCDKVRLRIYRCGAIRTPTRRHRIAEQRVCPFCMFPDASARHFWQDCDRFSATRTALCIEFGIQATWWGQQPACTSKSGWITLGAHPKADKRVSFQIAACRLGLAIMQAMPCDDNRHL